MPVQIGASASPFSDPTGLLTECHRRIESFLHSLRVAAGFNGRALSPDEKRALEAALRYFREAAPKHNADEEQSLFPRMRSANSAEAQASLEKLEELEQQHQWAAPLHAEAERIGQRWLAEGALSAADAQRFREVLDRLAAMYQAHIEFEDRVLFPLAERMLSSAEKKEIGTEMAQRRNVTHEPRQ